MQCALSPNACLAKGRWLPGWHGGKDWSAEMSAALAVQESFTPIIDVGTGQDLVPAMVHAEAVGDWDFTGMFTLILYHNVSRASWLADRHAFLLRSVTCSCKAEVIC